MADFQTFIHHWQFDRQRCAKGPVTALAAGGFGISVVYTNLKTFFLSLEFGRIFRPMGHYLWADTNASACTLGIDSLDCYHALLSPCGLPGHEHLLLPTVDATNATNVGRAIFPAEQTDMCMLAKATKKPLVWVFGQMVHYETRLSPTIAPLVQERVQTVLRGARKPPSSSMVPGGGGIGGGGGGLVMAVHVRAGKPDRGRHVLSMDQYMAAIDVKVHELAQQGQQVSLVYLASQHHESTFVSVDHMNRQYPRNFSYAVLPITPQNGQVMCVSVQ